MMEKKMSRFDKQRKYLVDLIEMKLNYFNEYKINGVSLYDEEIENLNTILKTLKSSKQFKNENNIFK